MTTARTNFCCRNGGSNLNAGTRIGNTTVPGTTPDFEYMLGSWVSATGVFTVASGNPSSDGIVAGDFASVFGSVASTTFSGASGAVPSGWSTKYTTSGSSWTEDAGGFLRITHTAASSSYRGLSFDTYSPTDGNVEILTKIRTSLSPSGTTNYGGVMARGSGSAGSEAHYGAYLRAASGTAQIVAARLAAGSLVASGTANFSWVANTWYWIRFRVIGTSIRVRIWADGGSEPSTWNVDIIDSNIAATSTGYCGCVAGNGITNGTVDFDSFEATPLTWTRLGRVTASSSTTITVSTTVGVGTAADGTSNRTLRIGGAWAGPEAAFNGPLNLITNVVTNAAGDLPQINVKDDVSLTISAAITSWPADLSIGGFTTAYEDRGRFSLRGPASGNAISLIGSTVGANAKLFDAVLFNNGSTTSSTAACFFNSTGGLVERVIVHDVVGIGFQTNTTTHFEECEAYLCMTTNPNASGAFQLTGGGCSANRCIAHDNAGSTVIGFYVNAAMTLTNCIADTNGSRGFQIEGNGVKVFNCDAYNNVSDGLRFNMGTNATVIIENCNFIKNGGYGIAGAGAGVKSGRIVNCGFGAGTQANTSGTINAMNATEETGTVTYANDVTPWVDPANGDFRINLAAAKGSGRGSFTQTATSYAGTVGYPDIGAAQHQDAGVSTTNIFVNRGRRSVERVFQKIRRIAVIPQPPTVITRRRLIQSRSFTKTTKNVTLIVKEIIPITSSIRRFSKPPFIRRNTTTVVVLDKVLPLPTARASIRQSIVRSRQLVVLAAPVFVPVSRPPRISRPQVNIRRNQQAVIVAVTQTTTPTNLIVSRRQVR